MPVQEHNQSNPVPNPYALGPSNQQDKSRDRPLSVPNQAAIQGLMCPDPQLKALQPYPQSPRQVQEPRSGSNSISIPAVKLVSDRSRCRSHSPSHRIDVDIEPEYQGGWQRGMMPAASAENLMVPSDWMVTPFDSTDPLSQSFPDSALYSALPRQRNSYSPASNRGNFLQVPDKNGLCFPTSDMDRRGDRGWQNARSSSMIDLSASAPAGTLRQNLNQISSHCFPPSTPTTPPVWLGLSPRTSPQNSLSYSPQSYSPSHSPISSSPLSPWPPQISPEILVTNTDDGSPSPFHDQLHSNHFSSSTLLISPASTPRCSPYGSPFGSQTCVRSVGAEC